MPLNHLSALYPASGRPSPKVRKLIDFLVAEYQPVPPWDAALGQAAAVPASAPLSTPVSTPV
jgi:hypothetical protein